MNDIQTIPPSPMAMIASAIEKGMAIADLKGLFDLQERYERNEAAKVFAASVTGFQSECLPIIKGNAVHGKNLPDGTKGPVHYKFAPYDDIMAQVQPLLTKFGITPTYSFRFEGAMMHTTCHIRVGTHVEDTTVPLAIPQIPNANDSQRVGGALKYGMRYSLVAALNIPIAGEDNDANGQETYVGKPELKLMNDLIDEYEQVGTKGRFPMKGFLEAVEAGLTGIDLIQMKDFTRAVDLLRRKLRETRK